MQPTTTWRQSAVLFCFISLSIQTQAAIAANGSAAKARPAKSTKHTGTAQLRVWTSTEIQAALDAEKMLRRLHAATAIGVTSADYHNRLIDTSADVTEDLRQVPHGPVYDHIFGALQAYTDAGMLSQKVADAISTLPPDDETDPLFAILDPTKTTDLDTFNSRSDVHSIQTRYGVPKVTADARLMQANADQYTQALQDEAATYAQVTTVDPKDVPSLIDKTKPHLRVQWLDRTIDVERTTLTAYLASSLSTIWTFADTQEQQAEAAIPNTK